MNPKEPYIHVASSKSFSVAHYSGTVSYQLKDVLEKNRDFLAPEVVETMRMSKDNVIKDLFSNRLTKSGNLTICRDKTLLVKTKNNKISRWGAALISEKTPIRVRKQCYSNNMYIIRRIISTIFFYLAIVYTYLSFFFEKTILKNV